MLGLCPALLLGVIPVFVALGRVLGVGGGPRLSLFGDDALARADEVLAGVESGELSTDSWQTYDDQGRGGADLETYVLQKVFSMPRPDDGGITTGKAVSSEQAAVVVLEAVNDGEVDRESQEYTQLRQFMAQLEGQREYTAYQQYLRNQAEIERP